MARLVLAGIGDLNSRVAQRWLENHGDVVAMRHSSPDPNLAISQVQVDLAQQAWPDLQADYLVIALSAKTRSLTGYQDAYLEPIKRLKSTLPSWQKLPKKIIVVSSSRVFSVQQNEDIVDTSLATSDDPYAQILMAMEHELWSINTTTCAATLSGIYNYNRDWFKRMARNAVQEPPKTNHWTNRIHIDDAAAALVFLLQREGLPARVIVSDEQPLPFCQVLNYLRQLENLPALDSVPSIDGGKRLRPKFLQQAGFKWQYPNAYSGGYIAP